MRVNTHLQQLDGNYLFTEIANRTQAYQQAHPEAKVLRLGIGDVTLPLPPAVMDRKWDIIGCDKLLLITTMHLAGSI